MIWILENKSGKYCLVDVVGEVLSRHKNVDSVVKAIIADHIECQRFYDSTENHAKLRLTPLRSEDQQELESLLSVRIHHDHGLDAKLLAED